MFKYHRHSIRLPHYDYSTPNLYFVTICTYQRECLFGDIVDRKMVLNDHGKIVNRVWQSLPDHHPVGLDSFQIMPNHIHLIIHVRAIHESPNNHVGCINQGVINHAPTDMCRGLIYQTQNNATTLGKIIRHFKARCSFNIHKDSLNQVVFQRNFYDRIIRNETELNKIREYIHMNPSIWDRDRNNPKNIKSIL